MPRRLLRWAVTTAALAAMSAFVGAQGPAPEAADKAYVPLRTPWGDPDLQGAYTNSDESQTPMERPKELESRQLQDITPQELASLNEQRNQARGKPTRPAGNCAVRSTGSRTSTSATAVHGWSPTRPTAASHRLRPRRGRARRRGPRRAVAAARPICTRTEACSIGASAAACLGR